MIRCYGHFLNLAIQDVIKGVSSSWIDTVQEIMKTYKEARPKCDVNFERIIKEVANGVPIIHKYNTLDSLG